MTTSDDDAQCIPFDPERVARARSVAVDAVAALIRDEYDGTFNYVDAVFTGLAICAQLCATADDLAGTKVGVATVADSVNSGGFGHTVVAYHHSLREHAGYPMQEDEYDA